MALTKQVRLLIADGWVEVTAELKPTSERINVVVIGKSADKPVKGELMDIDWIQFNAP